VSRLFVHAFGAFINKKRIVPACAAKDPIRPKIVSELGFYSILRVFLVKTGKKSNGNLLNGSMHEPHAALCEAARKK
jgi:hypothetical protein